MNFPFRLPALLLAGLAAALPLAAQTVLDDFSTDQLATKYLQKSVPGFSATGWNVTGGQLQLDSVSAGGYAAFVWTGNSLSQVGDSFSIDLYVDSSSGNHNGGFNVWQSNLGLFDRVVEPRLSYDGGYSFVGSDQLSQRWSDSIDPSRINGWVTLMVTLSDRVGNNTILTTSLSDGGGLIASNDFTVPGFTAPLYIGPSAWQAAGGNIAFDNLTFTSASAIPEPSTYATLAGALVLGFTAWQRRRAAIAA